MIRVERGHAPTLDIVVVDEETPVNADAPPTVSVTDWTGTVVDSATAVQRVDGDSEPIVGAYRVTLDPVDHLDLLTVTWNVVVATAARPVVQTVEVVAGFYFEIAELRAMPAMGAVARYPFAALVKARQWAEELIDREVGTSFVERFHVEQFTVNEHSDVRVSYPYLIELVSATVDDEDIDATPQIGGLEVAALWTEGVARVAYTSAWTTRVPTDLHDAALTAARYHLLATVGESGIPDRTRQQTNADGTIVLSVAGEKAPTGLPEVDVVIRDYQRRCAVPMLR